MDAVTLYCSDRFGVYIPKEFAETYDRAAWAGINSDDVRVLCAGPEHEEYWDAWEAVLNSAWATADDGHIYRLHQDGDLWVICYERMTDEEKRNFGFDIE